jgi:hypothetical protein
VKVPAGADGRWIEASKYEIDIAGTRVPARASLRPFFDPSGSRIRAR